MKIVKIESNGSGGVKVELEKVLKEGSGRTCEIGESAYVNLNTEANITFSKGIVL